MNKEGAARQNHADESSWVSFGGDEDSGAASSGAASRRPSVCH